MLTKEKQADAGLCLAGLVLSVGVVGCGPFGSDALLDGKRLLDRGQPVVAARKFQEATALLPTNALAWGYLGLAYHQGGAVSNAVAAYTRALALSPELGEVRFNLGCLWLEQGQWGRAREQFGAVAVLQPANAAAWQRLGEAQSRLGQSRDAVAALQESVRLDSRRADAWNWLGVAQWQQGRPSDAVVSFETALKLRANHGPALLNLAIVHHTKLNQPEKAIERYGQYLAFWPGASNAPHVRQALAELTGGPRSTAPTVSVGEKVEVRGPDRAALVPTGVGASDRTGTVALLARPVMRTNQPSRAEPAAPTTTSSERAVAEQKPFIQAAAPVARVEEPAPIVSVAQPPVVVPAQHTTPRSATSSEDAPVGGQPAAIQESGGGKGFFAKMNPVNLFRKRSEPKRPTPLPSRTVAAVDDAAGAGSTPVETSKEPGPVLTARVEVANPDRFARYPYRHSTRPAEVDTRSARRAFEQGEQLRKRGRKAEAIQAYQAAVESDPGHFSAQFNLGLLSMEQGDLATALRAFEAASRIEPASAPARYNFALVLKSGGYPVDSANELLILLGQDPDDVRGHLTLGNLYAQQFGDKGKARAHYVRVLELDPGHPQAGSIHFWLVQNPP
jgi:tetratricopeptide (TPR) repeat protein